MVKMVIVIVESCMKFGDSSLENHVLVDQIFISMSCIGDMYYVSFGVDCQKKNKSFVVYCSQFDFEVHKLDILKLWE